MSGKKSRSNNAQIRALVDFMSTNPSFAAGDHFGPLVNRRAEAQWHKLKELLKTYGPDRSIGQWKRTWHDLKKNDRRGIFTSNTAVNFDAAIPTVSENCKKILYTIGQKNSTDIEGVGPAESPISSFSNTVYLMTDENEVTPEQNRLVAEAGQKKQVDERPPKHQTITKQAVTEKVNSLASEKMQLIEMQKELVKAQLEEEREKAEHNRLIRAMELEELKRVHEHNKTLRAMALKSYVKLKNLES